MTRVCVSVDCPIGGEQPLANFRLRKDRRVNPHALRDRRCKACYCKAEKARYDKLAKDRPKEGSRGGRPLTRPELTPCTMCGLRGHEPGDPDRCLPSVILGLQHEWP